MIREAMYLAIEKHEGQSYGTKPYTYHLNAVVSTAVQFMTYTESHNNIDRNVIYTSCWLHDIIEDTNVTLEFLEEQFGKDVAEIVDNVTKRSDENHDQYMKRVCSRKESVIVKLCDSLSNLNHSVFSNHKKRITRYSKNVHILTNMLKVFK